MKKSNILLLTIAALFIGLVAAGMILLRSDVLKLVAIAERTNKYETVPTETFNRLAISDKWKVSVRQGIRHKVEVMSDDGSSVKPTVESKNGILYLNAEGDSGLAHAKITAPSIREIMAGDSSQISFEGFQQDSLQVVLENGAFISKEVKYRHISIKTIGEVLVELTDDPNK